jgi:DNA-binding NarL/FixJ family response regulator
LVTVLRTTSEMDRAASSDSLMKQTYETTTAAGPKHKSENSESEGGMSKFGLTSRELEIINAIVDGQSNRDIANTYQISQYTVKHHLTRIFDKVGVYSRLELAMFAIHHQLHKPHQVA